MPKQTTKILSVTGVSSLVAVIAIFLASCGATPSAGAPAATDTPIGSTLATSTPQPTVTIRPTATVSPAGPITPIGWATYHGANFSIDYPANWYLSGTDLNVENFDPRANQFNSEGIPGPPYIKIEVFVDSNASNLSPSAFFQAQVQDETPQYGTPTPGSIVTKSVQVAGQAAFQAYLNIYGTDVPVLEYFVPDSSAILVIVQYSVTSGDPSPIFAHVIASLHLGA